MISRKRKKKTIKNRLVLKLRPEVSESSIILSSIQLVEKRTLQPAYLHEEVYFVALLPPSGSILLWSYPPTDEEDYEFSPDRRTRTHKLFGKPALGPSPPFVVSLHAFNAA